MNAALDIDKPGKTKRSKRTTDMTTGSPAKLLFYFAMPLLSEIYFSSFTIWLTPPWQDTFSEIPPLHR